jgi:hypothetical protein
MTGSCAISSFEPQRSADGARASLRDARQWSKHRAGSSATAGAAPAENQRSLPVLPRAGGNLVVAGDDAMPATSSSRWAPLPVQAGDRPSRKHAHLPAPAGRTMALVTQAVDHSHERTSLARDERAPPGLRSL